jgi:hypothetical protein
MDRDHGGAQYVGHDPGETAQGRVDPVAGVGVAGVGVADVEVAGLEVAGELDDLPPAFDDVRRVRFGTALRPYWL